MPGTATVPPDDRADLVEQAVDIVGRAALPEVLELVEGYRTALAREDGLRWSEAGKRVEALWSAARDLRDAIEAFPRELMELANFDRRTLLPAASGAHMARIVAMSVEEKLCGLAEEYTAGGRGKRLMRSPPAKLRMAEAAWALMAEHCPEVLGRSRGGQFHQLLILIHQLATDSDDEGGFTGVISKVGKTQNHLQNA
jgi:hypothetical protein